jgi:invasion protein IalB
MSRYHVITAAAFALVLGAADAAEAQQRQAARQPGTGEAFEIGQAGSWTIYRTGEGRARTCFIAAKPAERLPRGLNRDPATLFIAMRTGDGARNEFSLITGFALKPGVDGVATIGSTSFAMVGKDQHAWLKNPAEEARFVQELRRGSALTIKATSLRGNETTDRYTLSGFGQALDRAQRECS